MDRALELQLQKVIGLVSEKEKAKNKALERQTYRLVKAILYMKALIPSSVKLAKVKG